MRQIEQALNKQGYDAGQVDGQWDESAAQALLNYQQAQNMEPTGNLNTRTVASLDVQSDLQALSGGGQGGQTGGQQQQTGGQQQGQTGGGQQQGQTGGGQQQGQADDADLTVISPEGEVIEQED